MPERIFVVGHAAVTCLGRDMDSTWQGLIEGRSGIRRHAALGSESFLQDLGGWSRVSGRGRQSEDPAIAKLSARFLHLAMAAARSAYVDAGLDRQEESIDPHRAAVVMGSAFGGLDLLDAEQERMSQRRSLAVSPYLVPAMIINQAAGQIAQHLRLYGPSAAPANACASGGHAVVLGAMFLRSGEADLALCGAGESAFTPAVVNGFATMKALLGRKPGDRSEDDPAQASRPFSGDRAGFVLAEGAGALVLATESAARSGWGSSPGRAAWAGRRIPTATTWRCPVGDRIGNCLTTALERARAEARDDRLLQRPRHQHGAQRPGRDPGAQGCLRRRGTAAADQLDQGGAGPQPGCGLGHRGGRLGPGPRASRSSRRRSISCPTRSSTWIMCRTRRGRAGSIIVLTASFGFGGTNNALILRRTAS